MRNEIWTCTDWSINWSIKSQLLWVQGTFSGFFPEKDKSTFWKKNQIRIQVFPLTSAVRVTNVDMYILQMPTEMFLKKKQKPIKLLLYTNDRESYNQRHGQFWTWNWAENGLKTTLWLFFFCCLNRDTQSFFRIPQKNSKNNKSVCCKTKERHNSWHITT